MEIKTEIKIGDIVMVCQTKDNFKNNDFNIEMIVVSNNLPNEYSYSVRHKTWAKGLTINVPQNYCKLK